jgi:hypothetical protein
LVVVVLAGLVASAAFGPGAGVAQAASAVQTGGPFANICVANASTTMSGGISGNDVNDGNDDNYENDVPLGFTADFFGQPVTQVDMSNNGEINTSGTPYTGDRATFTPYDITQQAVGRIDPFFADVDTRPYDPTTPADGDLLRYGNGTLPDGTKVFCALWNGVGYYSDNLDKLNYFQALLEQTPAQASTGNFTIVFNYNSETWETGDASGGTLGLGGTSALAGWTDGSGDSAVLPGSLINGGLLDSNPQTALASNSVSSDLAENDTGTGAGTAGVAGRYAWLVDNSILANTGVLTGTVSLAAGGPASGATVQICPAGGATASNPCRARGTDDSGVFSEHVTAGSAYVLTAAAGAGDDSGPGSATSGVVASGETTTQDVTLGPQGTDPVAGGGPGSDNGSFSTSQVNGEGHTSLPVGVAQTLSAVVCPGAVGVTSAGPDVTITGVPFGGGSEQTLAQGVMAVVAGALTADQETVGFGFTPPATFDGVSHIRITGTCPGGGSIDDEFDVWIDPSGTVTNSLGAPIAGATVTLLRADTQGGTFAPVLNGSSEMSPGNRRNPDTSGTDGTFGWDVVPGYYEVRASSTGCVSAADHSQAIAMSAVFAVPPPQLNLKLALFCGESAPPVQPPVPVAPPVPGPTPPVTPTAASVVAAVTASLKGQLAGQIAAARTNLGKLASTFVVPLSGAAAGSDSVTITGQVVTTRFVTSKHKKTRRKVTTRKTVTIATGVVSLAAAAQAGVAVNITRAGLTALRSAAAHRRSLAMKFNEQFTPRLGTQVLAAVRATGPFSVRPVVPKKKRK